MNRTARLVVGIVWAIGILIVLAEAFFIQGMVTANHASASPGSGGSGAAGSTKVGCSPIEQLATHYHVAVRIYQDGVTGVLPAGAGIQTGCFYWIHVHDNSGIVHIEAPASFAEHQFVVGDAFTVAAEPLDAHHLRSETYRGTIVAYINGARWSGAAATAPLKEGDTVDLVAPGQTYSYVRFDWPPGFLAPTS